jgi:hypothetical protein
MSSRTRRKRNTNVFFNRNADIQRNITSAVMRVRAKRDESGVDRKSTFA